MTLLVRLKTVAGAPNAACVVIVPVSLTESSVRPHCDVVPFHCGGQDEITH